MGAHELSAALWRERELLELLLFKLDEEQLLLTAGKTRWLPFATREVEQVLERLKTPGLERAAAVTALADEWGVADDATLAALIAAAPTDAWRDTFAEHQRALTSLTGQIAELRDQNLQFLRSAARSTQETLAGLGIDAGTYDARGTAGAEIAPGGLLDDQG